MASTTRPAPTVGFDLDMTLIDSRPGIRACYLELSARTGTHVDADLAVTRLGPPLAEELAHWFPAGEIEAVADLYREIYPAYAIELMLALPGAREAVAAVREAGGRAVVVTAKYEPNAKLHLVHLGIEPDAVIGGLRAEQKAVALREHGARLWARASKTKASFGQGDVRGAAGDQWSCRSCGFQLVEGGGELPRRPSVPPSASPCARRHGRAGRRGPGRPRAVPAPARRARRRPTGDAEARDRHGQGALVARAQQRGALRGAGGGRAGQDGAGPGPGRPGSRRGSACAGRTGG
ncbi:hypothetical protein STENM327S_04562 [Streptomyces tendae]